MYRKRRGRSRIPAQGNALGAEMKSDQGTLKEFANVELVTVVNG